MGTVLHFRTIRLQRVQTDLIWQSQQLGVNKTVSTFALNLRPLRINNKTEPPATWGGWQGPLIQRTCILSLPRPLPPCILGKPHLRQPAQHLARHLVVHAVRAVEDDHVARQRLAEVLHRLRLARPRGAQRVA
jgi:hypothetical protein